MKKISIQTFIENNRKTLMSYIQGYLPVDYKIDDDEISAWIWNDEYLHNWAKSEGVEE